MYPIGDLFTQLKNAQAARHKRALIPFSKIKFEIAKILKDSGFIQEAEARSKKVNKSKKIKLSFIDVKLKYDKKGEGAITGVKLLSKPSRRIYIGNKDIRPIKSGFGISILSTPKGIMNGKDAKKQGVGGEFIAEIW